METANQIIDPAAHIDEFRKICGPIIEKEHLWVCSKFMCLHIPLSLRKTLKAHTDVQRRKLIGDLIERKKMYQ